MVTCTDFRDLLWDYEYGLLDTAESQAVRVNSVMEQLGAPGQSVGRMTVTSAPGMQLYAETAEVDRATGDVEFARVK